MIRYNIITMNEYEELDGLGELYTKVAGLRKYLFMWVYPLVKYGNTSSLMFNHLPKIHKHDQTEWNFLKFKEQWQNTRHYSILVAFYTIVWRNFKYYWILLTLLQIVLSFVGALNPVVVNAIIQLFENERPNYPLFIRTYIFFFAYLAILMLGSPANSFINTLMSMKLSGALKGMIADKMLRVQYPLPAQGDMLNLLTVDVNQACQLMSCVVSLIMTPFQLVMSIYIYFQMLGTPAFVGIVGLTFQFCFNIVYAIYYSRMQVSIMTCKDARMRSINEMLFGINTIKQNGYYGFFSKKISERRLNEMTNIRNQALITLLISLISGYGFPIAVIYFTFKMFEIFSLSNIIAVQQNYFSLLNIINSVPGLISTMLVGGVSLRRLMNFFQMEDRPEDVAHAANQEYAVFIQDGNFKWNRSIQSLTHNTMEEMDHHFQLRSINMNVKKGKQILVVGRTGCGKTSLMYSIMGELHGLGCQPVQINGRISVATQEPWIVQTTLLKNIIHQESLDEERLMKVLEVTQLGADLLSMQSGINTDVGENGATLSGGQRKRVHLSRALYQKGDIYLLDSPLSALDPKVAQQLAANILTYLKGSTVIIFSNSTLHWQGVDHVYVLDEGSMVKEGSYASIASKESVDQDDINKIPESFEKLQQSQQFVTFKAIDLPQRPMVDEEDRQTGHIPLNIYRSLYNFFGGWTIFVGCGLMSLMGTLLNLYYQQYLSQLTGIAAQQDISDQEKQQAANKYLIVFPILYCGQAIFSMSQNLVFVLKGIKASMLLHAKIVDNLLRASVQRFYNVILASRIKNRLSNDIYQFDMNTSSNISSIYNQCFGLLAMILAAFIFSTIYTYPAQIFFIAFVVYLSKMYLKTAIELYRLQALSISPMLNLFQEIWQGVLYIRHCTDMEEVKQRFFTIVDENQKTQLAINVVGQWFSQTTNIMMLFIYTALLVANYQDFQLNEQQASIALYISISLSEQFFSVVNSLQNFYQNLVYYQRCSFLMNAIPREDEADELGRDEHSIQVQDGGSEVELATIQSLNIESADNNALVVLNLGARYRVDLAPVLRDVSFVIKAREKVAIIGRTGSGKTSLIQCVTRLISYDAGSIECFGRNYSDATVEEIRTNFSVISQDPFTFEGTILQNIDPMNQYRDEEEIKHVIAQYSPKELGILNRMQEKVDELGKNLSLGERQLLVLIRIMLQQRRMVILDECTGSLDQEYSDLIQHMMAHYLKDKTVLNVTHKLDMIRDCDRAVLVDSGQIQLIGSVESVVQHYRGHH